MGILIDHLRKKPVNIIITNVCNLKCGGCTQHCGLIPKEKLYFIDEEQFLKSVSVASKMHQNVHLFGGEACLHPNIENFLSSTSDFPNNRFFLWTNGRYKTIGEQVTTQYQGTSYSHPAYKNVVVQVDFSKKGRSFAPTLIAPTDVLPPCPQEDYFKFYAQKHCFVWKYCSMIFYGNQAYACECAGSFDKMGDSVHGWEIKDNLLDSLTDEDVVTQMTQFCYRCGLCLPPDIRKKYDQKTDDPALFSQTNQDLVNLRLPKFM